MWVQHHFDLGSYGKLEAQYANYRAQVEHDSATAEKNRTDDIVKVQHDAHSTNVQNAYTIARLQSENLNLYQRNLDIAHRLLAAGKAPTGPDGDNVPQSADPGASDAKVPPGTAEQLAGALTKCDLNANEHDALIDVLNRQKAMIELTP